MKILAKILLGATIGTLAGIVVASVIESKKAYAELNSKKETSENTEKSETRKKIEAAAKKMTAWILDHNDDIQALTLIITFTAAILKLVVSAKYLKGATTMSAIPGDTNGVFLSVPKGMSEFLKTLREEDIHGVISGSAGNFEIIPIEVAS